MDNFDYNIIEDYIKGNLTKEESNNINLLKTNDKELSKAINWYTDLLFVSKNFEDLTIQNALHHVEMELTEETYFKQFINKKSNLNESLEEIKLINELKQVEQDLIQDQFFENDNKKNKKASIKSIRKNKQPLKKKFIWRAVAGIALLMAALSAEGESIISNIEQIDRGYQQIDTRLQSLGAVLERI